MLRAQVGDDLCNLGISERVGEGWHFAPAVENLLGDPRRRPVLVLADIGKRRSLLCAGAGDAVAMLASFIAKENGSGLFVGPGIGGKELRREHQRQKRESKKTGSHSCYFRMSRTIRDSTV